MGRKIRLTESEFHRLVRRLVIETKEKMDDENLDHEDMDNESDYSKMSKEKAIKKIADYLKSELTKNEEQKLKNFILDKNFTTNYVYSCRYSKILHKNQKPRRFLFYSLRKN